jgi:hypothetical protein
MGQFSMGMEIVGHLDKQPAAHKVEAPIRRSDPFPQSMKSAKVDSVVSQK